MGGLGGDTLRLLVLPELEVESVKVCGLHSITRHREFWVLSLLRLDGHAVYMLDVDPQ